MRGMVDGSSPGLPRHPVVASMIVDSEAHASLRSVRSAIRPAQFVRLQGKIGGGHIRCGRPKNRWKMSAVRDGPGAADWQNNRPRFRDDIEDGVVGRESWVVGRGS